MIDVVGHKTEVAGVSRSEGHLSLADEFPFCVSSSVALHKMIRLITASTINGGYLNFMGNEFGHPEWVDFPREGNDWSHKYARRQWSLADNEEYLYHDLNAFDQDMIKLVSKERKFNEWPIEKIWDNEKDQVIAYRRKDLLFVYNFNPTLSFTDYGILIKKGTYEVVLDSDNKRYGGFALNDDYILHHT